MMVLPASTAKAAGYTHRISWKAPSPVCRVLVTHSFPTTADALPLHMKALRQQGIRAKVEVIK